MSAVLPTGRERVLVVDDDEGIRFAIAKLLRMLGYQVTTAEGAEAALARLDATGGDIDLLVTDIQMPGMNGDELAQATRVRRPGIRVLYVSGDHSLARVGRGVAGTRSHFLGKPFEAAELASRVREALEA